MCRLLYFSTLLALFLFVNSQQEMSDWSEHCDPWNVARPIDDTDYGTKCTNATDRSISGCGDFWDDPRNLTCDVTRTLQKCSQKIFVVSPSNAYEQIHLCIADKIDYSRDVKIGGMVGGTRYPPTNGRHRERWAKWGVYEFLPQTRWLHNVEHGAAIFLYHPCLSEADICTIRNFASTRPPDITDKESTTGPFRWILTPYLNLSRNLAIVTYGGVFLSDCWNEDDISTFLKNYYRWALEDVARPGFYNYSWVSDQPCEGFVASGATSLSTSYIFGILGGIIFLLFITVMIIICFNLIKGRKREIV